MPAIGRVMSLASAGRRGRVGRVLAARPARAERWRPTRTAGSTTAATRPGRRRRQNGSGWSGKAWPPPATFDATSRTPRPSRRLAIELVSPVDPAYGLRVRRTRDAGQARSCSLTTVVPEGRGAARARRRLDDHAAGVAAIACSRCCPSGRRSRADIAACSRRRPGFCRVDGRLLGLARDTTEKTMIAIDADALLWVGRGRSGHRDHGDLRRTGADRLAADRRRRAPRGRRARADLHQPRRRRAVRRARAPRPLVDLAPGQRTMMSVRYRLLRARGRPTRPDEARRVFADRAGAWRP